jgi:RES domain-containing protein
VWAEWSAATGGAIDPASERRRLWRIDASDLPLLDLRRPEVRAELDISLAALTGGRARAHGLARRARTLGAEGMIVPSAARDGAWNLVVFPGGFARVRVDGSRAMNPRPPDRSRFTG